MRFLVLGVSLAALAASQSEASQTCSRGEDVRVIEVATPGEVGAACDLRYVRDGGSNVSVPYHADNDSDFCAERERALVASLVDAGFVCTEDTPAPSLREVREREFDIEDILAGAETGEGSGDETFAAVAPQTAALGEIPPAPVLEQPTASYAETPSVSEAPAVAQRGPTALGVANASAPAETAAKPLVPSAGKLVGASPDAQPLTSSVTPAAPAPDPAAAVAASAPAKTSPADAQPATPMKLRPAADLIRAVLAAQAAAWNDGDLDDFMAGYWKSPNLRFVSGGAVTKGWEPTLKRYRERYGSGVGLGRLSFENIDVQMLTDDVAVVDGRFALMRDGKRDSGAFTLVMQRFDGLWRIVHDHTVADAPPAPAVTAAATQ
ncbi:MAG: DUF4440 domain-containing protein [Pseudomonadota bacterium]|nr:DUF4440 domain-containing protein [Pseudomonadota bacterium]